MNPSAPQAKASARLVATLGTLRRWQGCSRTSLKLLNVWKGLKDRSDTQAIDARNLAPIYFNLIRNRYFQQVCDDQTSNQAHNPCHGFICLRKVASLKHEVKRHNDKVVANIKWI